MQPAHWPIDGTPDVPDGAIDVPRALIESTGSVAAALLWQTLDSRACRYEYEYEYEYGEAWFDLDQARVTGAVGLTGWETECALRALVERGFIAARCAGQAIELRVLRKPDVRRSVLDADEPDAVVEAPAGGITVWHAHTARAGGVNAGLMLAFVSAESIVAAQENPWAEGWFALDHDYLEAAICLSRWDADRARLHLRQIGLLQEWRVRRPQVTLLRANPGEIDA
ncbi:MAG: hypothetical protein KF778_18285 [Rhodocyclaceae bacterium]|nr:hypothetical protein [Rhodocyclaceae bacterium]